MAKLSIREAVKLFDVSRPTLTKALNNGLLSGVRSDKGHWSIDRTELVRLYRMRQIDQERTGKGFPVKLTTENTPGSEEIIRLKSALALAEQRADAAEELARERAERIEDLRRILPAPSNSSTRRRWRWPWLR